MKRLINEASVQKAHERQESIVLDENTLITPSARDLAQELGVHLCTCGHEKHEHCCCSKQRKEEHSVSVSQESGLDADQIYKVLKMALEAGLWTEEEMYQALKGLA